jgi:hypothetical protein
MNRAAPLNAVQMKILRWISDGCPADGVEGHRYKTTARALHDRRLVVVTRTGGVWGATVTPDGAYYLQHGQVPPDPADSAQAALTPVEKAQALLAEVPVPVKAAKAAAVTPRVATGPVLGPTKVFVQRLVEAGGEMPLDYWSSERQLVLAANRHGMAPVGMRLVLGKRDGQSTVWLEALPEALQGPVETVSVPASLRGASEPVLALQERDSCLPVKGPARQRALLLLQALTVAMQRRGLAVNANGSLGRGYRRDNDEAEGVLTVHQGGHRIGVGLRQSEDRSAHVPTAKELADKERYARTRIPKWDHTPNERLILTLSGGAPQQKSTWSDGPRQSLDRLLGEVVREMALRFAAFEEADRERERESERRKVQWQAAMQRAKQDYKQVALETALERHTQAWHRAQQLRSYIAAMTEHAHGLPGEARDEAEAWIAFAKVYLADLDPLQRPLRLPDIPAPREADLVPHLHGWSPYGPR